MSPKVVWLPASLEDVERLHNFLNKKSPEAAARAAQTILSASLILEKAPQAGRPLQDETGRRELFVPAGAGAYVLRYKLDTGGNVVIIRVWHCREVR